MTIRKIALIGHPVLRKVAEPIPVDQIGSAGVQTLIDDLIETMRDANGAGIAAPQVHESVQVTVIEVGNNPRYPYKPKIPLTVLINPVITPLGEETFRNYEGCLSVPNLRGVVARYARIRLTAFDREGRPIDTTYQGFTAGTMQHECDHLLGKLFVDQADPATFTTWDFFERFHKEHFLETTVKEVVAKYHS